MRGLLVVDVASLCQNSLVLPVLAPPRAGAQVETAIKVGRLKLTTARNLLGWLVVSAWVIAGCREEDKSQFMSTYL